MITYSTSHWHWDTAGRIIYLFTSGSHRYELTWEFVFIVSESRVTSSAHQHLHRFHLTFNVFQRTDNVQGCVSTERLKHRKHFYYHILFTSILMRPHPTNPKVQKKRPRRMVEEQLYEMRVCFLRSHMKTWTSTFLILETVNKYDYGPVFLQTNASPSE